MQTIETTAKTEELYSYFFVLLCKNRKTQQTAQIHEARGGLPKNFPDTIQESRTPLPIELVKPQCNTTRQKSNPVESGD